MRTRALIPAACGAALGLVCLAAGQITDPVLPENAVEKISTHVHAIMGFPNIVIVVGSKATLAIDTGLGPRNGALVAREAQKLAPGNMLYLTTTHYHPEHASGTQAFPPATKTIRCNVQQQEVDALGAQMIDRFRQNASFGPLLQGDIKIGRADILFDKNYTLDLGGVTAKLMCLGPTHTAGDEEIFVPEDSVLASGDVVQDELAPAFPNMGASPKSWIAVLDELDKLHPKIVLPDHGTFGDGSLIGKEKAFLVDLRSRALELKREGKSADEAAQTINAELMKKYPGWYVRSVAIGVQAAYAEAP
jgi:glyoxylase-like metal-dependent hydrolase (beta-lactamase superfamily II)